LELTDCSGQNPEDDRPALTQAIQEEPKSITVNRVDSFLTAAAY